MTDSKKDKIADINIAQLKTDLPDFKAGDTVKVHTKIREGNKERVQVFQGIVIACKHGKGAQSTFTVRKVSYNVGVEKTFLLHSPRIEKIEILSRGDIRRAKLYYLRERSGKSARIKTKLQTGATKQEQETSDKEGSNGAMKEVKEEIKASGSEPVATQPTA